MHILNFELAPLEVLHNICNHEGREEGKKGWGGCHGEIDRKTLFTHANPVNRG
jgi:hypothetical protein